MKNPNYKKKKDQFDWTMEARRIIFFFPSEEAQKQLGIDSNAVKCQKQYCKRMANKADVTVEKWLKGGGG